MPMKITDIKDGFCRIFIFACLSILSVTAHALQRPNVILVVADDLGYGDIGVNGKDLINSPHLDSMAREGVQLEGQNTFEKHPVI